MILPVIMFLLLGMVEMGFAINHNTSIVTATRQGARVGAELGNGSSVHLCTDSTNAATVDPQIIAAVEGVLASPGSPVAVSQVKQIVIFEVKDDGTAAHNMTPSGNKNVWVSSVDGTGHPTGYLLPGSTTQKMYFAPGTPSTYPASGRCGMAPAPAIGVSITYTYKFITPLGALVASLGASQIQMTDQTIMALEPPSP
jgi:hypothetical protein